MTAADPITRITMTLGSLAALVALLSLDVVTMDADSVWNVTCPAQCVCVIRRTPIAPGHKPTRTADCQHHKLSSLPEDLPIDSETLLMKDNGISRIAPGSLDNMVDLKILDFSYNMLSVVESTSWNVSGAELMTLEGNGLRTLPHGGFAGLGDLQKLVLAKNSIRTIQTRAFDGLASLNTLDLSHNKLEEIHPEWFTNLTDLRSLSLDNNLLMGIEPGSFLSMTTLTKLSLSHNNLSSLGADSFLGLGGLGLLDLSYNRMTTIPSQSFSVFRDLKVLSLDGNQIKTLGSGSFQSLPIAELSLGNMATLRSIDKQSVFNMPRLHTLRIQDNPNLFFLHPQAFQKAPALEHLYLHNNKIKVLPEDLVLSLTNLKTISFYGNPLQCDCNVYWLKAALTTNDTPGDANQTLVTNTFPTFQDPSSYMCDSPADKKSMYLRELPLSSFTNTCSPLIIPLFQSSYQQEIGTSVMFECRAIGVPTPHIHWILSNGKIVNNTSNYSRIRLSSTGTLSVEHLKAQDAGTYTCVAENRVGYDTEHAVLKIHSNHIQILNRGAANNFITVTWNGTESTIATSDYMIIYRKASSRPDAEYKEIHLRPYMRRYTFSNLDPQTPYEFCISYKHSAEVVKLNCLTITTKSQMYMMHGIRTISRLTILLALCLTVLGVVLICVLMLVVRRYQRRKAYEDPTSSHAGVSSITSVPSSSSQSASRKANRFGVVEPVTSKVGRMSNIPLDNLYNPPNTPLCTSTTSLISTQSNA